MYDIITTNISESVNSMFLDEREFPMVTLFNSINERFHQIFMKHRAHVNSVSSNCVPRIEKMLRQLMEDSSCLVAYNLDNGDFAFVGENEPADSKTKKTVSLVEKTCTCRQFDLEMIPCIHATAAIRLAFGDEYGSVLYKYTS